MNSIDEQKRALRKEVLSLRDSIPQESRREKSELICKDLIARICGDSRNPIVEVCSKQEDAKIEQEQTYKTIGLFSAMKSEVDLSLLADALYDTCHVVCYPAMFRQADGTLDMDFAVVTRGVTPDFVANPLHVLQLGDIEVIDPKELDFLVCPLVAFDSNNNRMGYGGGNYDRYLPRLREDCKIVGVAFAEQKVDSIPLEPHDLPLSKIIYY